MQVACQTGRNEPCLVCLTEEKTYFSPTSAISAVNVYSPAVCHKARLVVEPGRIEMAREFFKICVARWHEWSNGTINQRIFRATLTISSMTAVVAFAYFMRELIIAGWFGTGDEVDAFFTAFLIPWATVLIMAGAFSGAVIPSLIRIREQEGRGAAQRFSSQLMGLSAAILLAATLALAMAGPWLIKLFGSGYGPEKLALTGSLFHVLLPILFLGGMSKMLAAILNAEERFAMAALFPVAGPLGGVLGIVVGGKTWGILALALGTTCGYFVEFLAVSIASREYGVKLLPHWFGMDKTTRHVVGEYGYLVLAILLQYAVPLTDQALAASLSSGSVSVLSYGSKIVGSLVGLGMAALEAAALPYFAILAGKGDLKSTQHTIKTYAVLVLIATIPLTVVLSVFSEPVIRILFQRGAFTGEDTALVAGVQTYWALQLPFYSLMLLGFRALSASGKNSVLARISLFNAVLNAILGYALSATMLVQGIALATVISFAAGMTITYLVIRKMSTEKSGDENHQKCKN
jgi:putative peptidoglycan lipid II flippase